MNLETKVNKVAALHAEVERLQTENDLVKEETAESHRLLLLMSQKYTKVEAENTKLRAVYEAALDVKHIVYGSFLSEATQCVRFHKAIAAVEQDDD